MFLKWDFFFCNSLMSHFFVVSLMDNKLSITDCLVMFSSDEDELRLECKQISSWQMDLVLGWLFVSNQEPSPVA